MPRRVKQLESVLIKPAGPDCNMACAYCFYLKKQSRFPATPVHRMSPRVLEETVRQVMQQSGDNVAFAWQGGEPTLMGVDFFRQAVELERAYGRAGQTVGNGLQTNGLLIDETWCRFLRESQFLVGLSLDGLEPVHDRYRVTQGGQPTWKRVMDALKRMLNHGVEVNALTLLNDDSSRYPREIYAFLKDSGLRHMQFIPCLERDPSEPGKAAPFSVSAEQYGTFLCEVFDCWWDDFRDGEPTTFIRWFDSVFATYVGVRPPECTLLSECGMYVVVEHNGDVFSCDFFVDDEWRLGNVLEGTLIDMLNSPRQAAFGRRKSQLPHECQTCPWLTHCRGGCPKERWDVSPNRQPSRLCAAYKRFFAHADARLRELADAWHRRQDQPPQGSLPPAPGPDLGASVGRNEPCPCGSGAKYKHCCGKRETG
jgi:uncharacterized protein